MILHKKLQSFIKKVTVILLCAVLSLTEATAVTVDENSIAAAILGTINYNSGELDELDLTRDGLVNAQDLACYIGDCSGVPNYVSFAISSLDVEEGEVATSITLNFNRHYSGNLLLEIDAESTAIQGNDFQAITTSLAVNGQNVSFDLNIIDDAVVSEQYETILIHIAESANYFTGAASLLTVNIRDNDELWLGSISTPFGSNEMRMEIVRQTGQATTAVMISDGTGNYPDGRFPATSFTETATTLAIDFLNIPIIADGTTVVPVLGANASCGALQQGDAVLTRGLQLRTDTVLNHDFEAELISGTATETINSVCSDYNYLNRNITGFSYLLIRQFAIDVDWTPDTCQLGVDCSWETP